MAKKGNIPVKESSIKGIPVTDVSSAQAALLSTMKPTEDNSEVEDEQAEVEETTPEQVTEDTQSVEEVGDSLLSENPQTEHAVESNETNDQEEQESITVNIDGNDTEVTLDELKAGYFRHADYTKKTMSLSDEKKVLTNELEQTRLERQNYLDALNSFKTQNTNEIKELEKTNWNELKVNDPDSYNTKYIRYLELKELSNKADIEHKELTDKANKENQEKLKQVIQENRAILSRELPILNDPQKGDTVKRAIHAFGIKNGFSEQEMSHLYDARSVMVLYKAMQYDNLQKTKIDTKKSKQVPKVTKSGSGVTKSDVNSEQVKKAKARLKRSGSMNDAAALIKATLG